VENSHILGELEVDFDRGVVYFHSAGLTMLRICRLPTPIPENIRFIDITFGIGVSYDVPMPRPTEDQKMGQDGDLKLPCATHYNIIETRSLLRIGNGRNQMYGMADHSHSAADVGAAPENHWHYDYESVHRDLQDSIRNLRQDLRDQSESQSGRGDNVDELLARVERYSEESQLAMSRLMRRVARLEEALSLPYLDQSEEQEVATEQAIGGPYATTTPEDEVDSGG
jgi:hypothetical protein